MVDGAVHIVGADGNVAVGAAAGGLVALHSGAGEVGGVAGLVLKAEDGTQGLGGLLRLAGVLAVDAHMTQLKAKHGLDGVLADAGDLVPLLALDQVLLHHPGAAAGEDAVIAQVVHQVLGVHAAGGHEVQLGEHGGQGLDAVDTAGLLGGEELHILQAGVGGAGHVGGVDTAGEDQHALLLAVGHQGLVIAGGDDELGACGQGAVALLQVEHSAGTHQHLGEYGGDAADGLLTGGGAEGDLGGGQAAGQQGAGQRDGLLSVIDGDDRDHTDRKSGFLNIIHGKLSFVSYYETVFQALFVYSIIIRILRKARWRFRKKILAISVEKE